jgi:hypothetical protein
MVVTDTLLAYPNFSEEFEIHTDASDYQLGATIRQKGKPIAFFSRKLTGAQLNYTMTEKELLSIIECLKAFHNILYGQRIVVWTDHNNLVTEATISQSQRVQRWRLILEEYGPDIRYIKGEENCAADALSRLPMTEDQEWHCTEAKNGLFELFNSEKGGVEPMFGFPLNLVEVQRLQNVELNKPDKVLSKLLQDKNSPWHWMTLDGVKLIMNDGKIYVPPALQKKTLDWYHHFLCHPGGQRLANTISSVCYWKGLTYQAGQVAKKCPVCQKCKVRSRRYGHLPPKEIDTLIPWDSVHIDLKGPYHITALQNKPGLKTELTDFRLLLMTMVDPATGWFEVAQVPIYDLIWKDESSIDTRDKEALDKSSARISQLFNQVWLARYPRPNKVIFDNGSEFKKNFVPLLKDFSIKPTVTSVKNPQSNAIVERIHQVIDSMIKTQNLEGQVLDYIDPFGELISSIGWAVRSSYHRTLQATPAQLVFGRDMIFNIKTVVNWDLIRKRKQSQVDFDNERENKRRISYDYKVGQRVYLVNTDIKRKCQVPHEGPYVITDVFTNGTVRIQRGITNERVNIRRITPHFE